MTALVPSLSVTITGIEQAKGQVVVAVYNSEEAYMDEDQLFTYKFIEVKEEGKLTFQLDLPAGSYAISVYHDINRDQKLNTNLVGAPKEPYGFSNNARALFSAPDYEEAVVTVNTDTSISISLE